MFTSRLVLVEDTRPDLWVLAWPLVWNDIEFGRIVVPRGFETDLASIPRVLRNLPALDPNGLSRRPAVLHDFIYTTQPETKEFADRLLRAALLWEGCSPFVAWAFFGGVHFFGQRPWDLRRAALPLAPKP